MYLPAIILQRLCQGWDNLKGFYFDHKAKQVSHKKMLSSVAWRTTNNYQRRDNIPKIFYHIIYLKSEHCREDVYVNKIYYLRNCYHAFK